MAGPTVVTSADSRARASRAGLGYRLAGTLDEALMCWRLHYTVLRRLDRIPPNPSRLHVPAQAVGGHTAVIGGWIGQVTVATLTAVADSPAGLPLDAACAEALRPLRADGRRLVEVGLLADRRHQLVRTVDSLFELARHVFHFAASVSATDLLMDVACQDAGFFVGAFSFRAIASTGASAFAGTPSGTLLRLDLDEARRVGADHPALAYILANPLPPETFAARCRFEPSQVRASDLGALLAAPSP